ncbi:MAG TPA: cytochrome c [Bradyrhizobium sp.]|nr:cytochrome c [Bradyrhizobium sp.]
MMRTALVVGALLLGTAAVMAQQDVAVTQQNLMKTSIGRPMYGVLGKMLKGDIPYDQAAVDKALTDMEAEVPKIADTFKPNPKQDVVNATYGSSQKIWQNKADFDSKIPAVAKVIPEQKGKIKDLASLKVSFDAIQEKCTGCHDDYRVKLK